MGREADQVLDQIVPVTEFHVVIWSEAEASRVLGEGSLQVAK